MTDCFSDPDWQRKAALEEQDIREAEENQRALRWHLDTNSTHLIRTPNDVLEAITKREIVGLKFQWALECLWLGDTRDMGDYHAYIWGWLNGKVVTEYMRRRHTGQGTVPEMGDRQVVLITKEQVDAIVDAARAVRESSKD